MASDGIDNSKAAGAIIDGTTHEAGRNIERFINNNNSYNFFKNTRLQIITGKTGTNVCDLMVAMHYG